MECLKWPFRQGGPAARPPDKFRILLFCRKCHRTESLRTRIADFMTLAMRPSKEIWDLQVARRDGLEYSHRCYISSGILPQHVVRESHWQNQQRETCARIVYEKGRQSKGEVLDFDTKVEAARRQCKHSLGASHLGSVLPACTTVALTYTYC
jgi:hypothetical protein